MVNLIDDKEKTSKPAKDVVEIDDIKPAHDHDHVHNHEVKVSLD